MSKTLVLNGKEYVPSAVLAKKHGYTSDYISKLAREEKILGTQIARQWYVVPSSLETFIHQSAFDKKIRAEKIRKQRLIERARKSTSTSEPVSTRESHTYKSTTALQTLAVLLCGSLAGGIGYLATQNNITLSDLREGTVQSVVVLSEPFNLQSVQALIVQSENNKDTQKETVIIGSFTDLPH